MLLPTVQIGISILPLEGKGKKRILKYVQKRQEAGASVIHVDVMDGEFVKQKTSFDSDLVYLLVRETGLITDIHLMVKEPNKYIESFAEAILEARTERGDNKKEGYEIEDMITAHLESESNPDGRPILHEPRYLWRVSDSIKHHNLKCGIALNPETVIKYHTSAYLDDIILPADVVLPMTVNPGEGGQVFMMNPLENAAYLIERGYKRTFAFDGCVNDDTAELIFLNCSLEGRLCNRVILNIGSALQGDRYKKVISSIDKAAAKYVAIVLH